MRTCVICGKRIKTGRKYCYEHRNTRNDNVVNRSTRNYIRYQKNKASIYYVVFFLIFFLPFLLIGFLVNECYITGMIGFIVSFALSLYIPTKFFDVSLNPVKDVKEKHPRYVEWVQSRVNKEKEEREFRKQLWENKE